MVCPATEAQSVCDAPPGLTVEGEVQRPSGVCVHCRVTLDVVATAWIGKYYCITLNKNIIFIANLKACVGVIKFELHFITGESRRNRMSSSVPAKILKCNSTYLRWFVLKGLLVSFHSNRQRRPRSTFPNLD